MKRGVVLAFLWSSAVLPWGPLKAQPTQAPATADQVTYFRFMLLGLASPDFSPDVVAAYQHALIIQHGLNNQEISSITEAASTLQALLRPMKQTIAQIVEGKQTLSQSDILALQSLASEREQLIASLANQILGSLRPRTTQSFRTAANLVAAAISSQAETQIPTPVKSSLAAATLPPPAQVSSLAALQDCIGPDGGRLGYSSICQLTPGTYAVPFTNSSGSPQGQLVIYRSGIVIEGMESPSDTTIQRGSSSAKWLMEDCVPNPNDPSCPSAITNVAVKNLTFDGNRYGASLDCLAVNAPYSDVTLTQGGKFSVQSVAFINSPGTALELAGSSTVSYSYFGWGGYGYDPSRSPGTETAQQSATRSTAVFLSGTGGGAYCNAIAFAGTAGINLTGTGLYVYGNFLHNNRYEMPDGQGGQIYVDGSSRNARVVGNVIDGNYWQTGPSTSLATGCLADQSGIEAPYGVEAYGSGHGFYNNQVEHHTGTGMVFGGSNPTSDITISSSNPWDSQDPARSIEANSSGIWFLGPHIFDFPDPTHGVTLDDIVVQDNTNFGVILDGTSNDQSYTGFVNGSCITGNGTNVYAPGATLSSSSPDRADLPFKQREHAVSCVRRGLHGESGQE